MGNIQTLRRLAVKLEPSGTAIAVENTKLYQGCYAYVWLKAYVPVTQNRSSDTLPICTVHGIIEDSFGNRRRLGARRYNMTYAETVMIDGFEYMLYERKMPKPLTDEIGDLDMVFNYSEITAEGTLSSRLASSVLHTRVEEGGESDGDIEIDLKSQEAAQINKNTFDIALIQSDIDELATADVELFDRVDVAEKDINTLKGGVKYLQDTKIDKTEKGAPNGVAPLGEDGIIPIEYLSIPGDLKYRGTWNPAAVPNPINWNSPEEHGSYYKATAGGEFPVGSGTIWSVGDWIISNGTEWERIATDTPTSVLPEGDKVLMRTSDGRAKGANAIEPYDLVNKAQLDGFRNRVQTAADNVDYAITVAIQSAGVADTALNNSVDAQTQSGQAIDTADAADESAKLTAERTKAINDKMQNAADNADFSVSMVMTLLAELEDIKQRLTALENK